MFLDRIPTYDKKWSFVSSLTEPGNSAERTVVCCA